MLGSVFILFADLSIRETEPVSAYVPAFMYVSAWLWGPQLCVVHVSGVGTQASHVNGLL